MAIALREVSSHIIKTRRQSVLSDLTHLLEDNGASVQQPPKNGGLPTAAGVNLEAES